MGKRGAAIALTLGALGLAGCLSSTLPPPLTEEQLAVIAATRFNVTVGVEEHTDRRHSTRLIEALRKTLLFDRVDTLSSFEKPPTFVARVERPVYGLAGNSSKREDLSFLTIASLGIIPTFSEREHGLAFSLRPSSTGSEPRKSQRIAVHFSHRGQSIFGWWAFFQARNPDQAIGDLREHRRFTEHVAWHIVARRSELLHHAAGGT